MKTLAKTLPADPAWKEASDLYLNLMSLGPEDRPAFLEVVTRDRPDLREKLDSLLADDAGAAPIVMPKLEPLLSPGDRLGDFEIVGTLGRGSFATVYLARQLSLGRDVALKITGGEGSEARTLAPLDQDHIVRLYSEERFSDRQLHGIAMQYISGITLERLLEAVQAGAVDPRQPVSVGELVTRLAPLTEDSPTPWEPTPAVPFPEACLAIGIEIASALSYAHCRQILHLDVKPANILLSRAGRAMLTDFNLAIERHPLHGAPESYLGGTLQYMPPEQKEALRSRHPRLEARRIGPGADVYALGTLLLELLGASEFFSTPQPGRDEIRAVLRKATRPEAENRYRNGEELRKALQGCLEIVRLQRELPPPSPLIRAALRFPLAALTVGGVLLQSLAATVAIGYNAFFIVGRLAPDQMSAFFQLLRYYVPIVSALVIAVWGIQIFPLFRFLRDPSGTIDRGASVSRLRARVLSLLPSVAALTFFAWMPGAVVFPAALWRMSHHALPLDVWLHFFLSFSLSTLVCLSYAWLFAEYVSLRTLYPRFWIGESGVRAQASQELQRSLFRYRWAQALAVGVPWLAVTQFVISGPGGMDADPLQFRAVVCALLAIGAGGQWLALRTSYNHLETFYRLTGLRTEPLSEAPPLTIAEPPSDFPAPHIDGPAQPF